MRRPGVSGRPRLPLAAWAGLLSAAAVLGAAAVTACALLAFDRLGVESVEALAIGTSVGLLLSLLAVVAAGRLAAALRAMQSDALARLQDPAWTGGRPGDRPVAARASSELAELAQVLEALHLRIQMSDEVGSRHRRDAETAGAGVFELLSGLVAAEEGARGQLAAELHDTVAQSLMIARGLLAQNPSTPGEITRLADYVEDAEEQVRAVMARTRPPALREGDLASAVDGLRADVLARYGLEVTVEWPPVAHPLPLASAVTLYRFFQEGLLNVVKHADVDEAAVRLEVDEQSVVAEVRDAGPGFDPLTVRPDRGRHVGLGLMRERARLSGGRVEVESGSGEGTVLRLRLPRSGALPAGRAATGTAAAAGASRRVAAPLG